MKRSTILLVALLLLVIVAPIIYIVTVINKMPSFKEWIAEVVESVDTDRGSMYEYKMSVVSSQPVPHCYMYVTTYRGAVDSLHSVNFVAPVEGVRAELIGDSIVLNLDDLKKPEGDGLILTVELPDNSTLKIDNPFDSVELRFNHAEMGAVHASTHGALLIEDCSVGAMMTKQNDSRKCVAIHDSSIGAAKIAGNATALVVADSNIGALSVDGTCDSIELSDSNMGVVSWNKECNDKAVVNDCVMQVKLKEDVAEADDALTSMSIIGEDGEKVDISLNSVRVDGADGEKVDISPSGVYVEDGETTVQVTPAGVVVKENGKEVVKVSAGGVTVK